MKNFSPWSWGEKGDKNTDRCRCWILYLLVSVFITNTLESFDVLGETSMKYYNIYNWFPFIAISVINPVANAVLSRPFRKEFLRILRCNH